MRLPPRRQGLRPRTKRHETFSGTERDNQWRSAVTAAARPGGGARDAGAVPIDRPVEARAAVRGNRCEHTGPADAHPASGSPGVLRVPLSLRGLQWSIRPGRDCQCGRRGLAVPRRGSVGMWGNAGGWSRVQAAMSSAPSLRDYLNTRSGAVVGSAPSGQQAVILSVSQVPDRQSNRFRILLWEREPGFVWQHASRGAAETIRQASDSHGIAARHSREATLTIEIRCAPPTERIGRGEPRGFPRGHATGCATEPREVPQRVRVSARRDGVPRLR